MPQTSYPQAASTSYNASTSEAAVDTLIERYGDRLQEISTVDKVGLLAILATWQHLDSVDEDGATLDYTAHVSYAPMLSESLSAIVNSLDGISDESTFSLMVAIANQLVAEQQS